jgi:hypothetical protein
VTMKNVFWAIKTHFIPHRRHITTTEPSQLMLCKIWGYHRGDYEEFCLLGYKNQVCTSQETYYVSATEPNGLMLCEILGFHGGMLCCVTLV